MTDADQRRFPHLLLSGTSTTERYTRPGTGGRQLRLPPRNRLSHGQALERQLEEAAACSTELILQRRALGLAVDGGICLQFVSDPGFPLKLDSLENQRSGIELLSTRVSDGVMVATVFVPEGKLSVFVSKIHKYLEEETQNGRPRNQPLVDSIAQIRVAALDAFWTDLPELMPEAGVVAWWEVWLRKPADEGSLLPAFRREAGGLGIEVKSTKLDFPDRTVVLASGTKDAMASSTALLNCIAEVRLAKENPAFFLGMSRIEQQEWVDDALARVVAATADQPAVCLLDTGVNRSHPLIEAHLGSSDMDSYDPTWGVDDHEGHGTELAGIALYGDLVEVLASQGPIELHHRLESVKILPPRGENDPDLYGAITQEAVARAEVFAPSRRRVACVAVSAPDYRDHGRPSSWSAALDQLASGVQDDVQRLVVVAAGNTNLQERHGYPDSNLTDEVHDPGQSWNALTIGACTENTFVDQTTWPDWRAVAPEGALSPCSCTSTTWSSQWPLKPDVVLEGGNMAINPGTGTADYLDSLGLLTTNYKPTERLLTITRDTSAATALAGRMCAQIMASYPQYWPETVRAIVAHSASWPEAMKNQCAPLRSRHGKEMLLRFCGFGRPNIDRALWSLANDLTLVAQDTLQPYDYIEGRYRTRDMHVHALPWPADVLRGLGETEVTMRVTLSYFVEPNPAQRGWKTRYRYASHGLRFEVKTPTETRDQFRARINDLARQEEQDHPSQGDAEDWFLGPGLRSRGSLHSDIWTGTAADLADRGYIAVYPVIGWWRERHQLGRWNRSARYALVVTISTPEETVDLYTPVANQVGLPVEL